MRLTISWLRSAWTLTLFAVFAIGALLISPLMLLLRRRERCQPIVRATWRLLLKIFTATRLIRLETSAEQKLNGAVIVANHPSLIDVVIITAIVPRTLYVAKRALRKNLFLSAIVNATSLPDDASLAEAAAPLLERGWNVLIFPEGTRSPANGGMHPFHRGAAQLALRTGADIVPLRIDQSRRILGKRQCVWDVGDATVEYRFNFRPAIKVTRLENKIRSEAIALTERLAGMLGGA